MPIVSAAALHAAVRTLPVPVGATAPQPTSTTELSVNWTLPVGTAPTMVAVNVTDAPANAGFAELASVVAPAAMMNCVSVAEDAGLPKSPEYLACITWLPAVSVLGVHAALATLPERASGTAPQPASVVPPSSNLTVPVGAASTTVIVNVIEAPTEPGLDDLASGAPRRSVSGRPGRSRDSASGICKSICKSAGRLVRLCGLETRNADAAAENIPGSRFFLSIFHRVNVPLLASPHAVARRTADSAIRQRSASTPHADCRHGQTPERSGGQQRGAAIMGEAIRTRISELGRLVRKAGPYVVLEVVMPGGTLFAFLLYLHRSGQLASLGEVAERAMDRAANGTFDQLAFALGPIGVTPAANSDARQRDGLEPLDLMSTRRMAA